MILQMPLVLGKVSRKKVAVLLDFVQITLTPPPLPLIWTTCTTFLNANVPKKFGQGSPPPLIWTESKRTATFFRETVPDS